MGIRIRTRKNLDPDLDPRFLFKRYHTMHVYTKRSDVDPDPVGSALIWIQRYKIKGKAEFNQQIFVFFCVKLYFSSLNLKNLLISKI